MSFKFALRLRLILSLLLTSAVLGLSACGVVGGSSGTPAGQRLADVEVVDDPRSIEGPSTATVADPAIEPIADNPEPQLPVTLTDAQGTDVTVTDVSRILAIDLYGSTSRITYELGLGDNIVGRDTSSGFAEIADRPLVTPKGHELQAEAILALAPTVIITDTSLGPWDVVLQMRDAGIPVVVVDSHRSLDTVDDLINQVATALGVPAEGEQLAQRTAESIERTTAQIAELAPDPGMRMVFLYVRGQSGIYYMFGTGSGADSLIDGLGGVDVAEEIGWKGMQPLNAEGLIKAEPELVLMMTKGLESTGGVDGLLEAVPALASTPAGEKRRIVDMSDTEILSFGPASAEVLEALAIAAYAPTTP